MGRRRRYRRARQVVRLADTTAAPPSTLNAEAAWHVIVLTDEDRRCLYTTMTRDVAFALHRATTPLIDGFTQSRRIDRLVHRESYACRHTAFARMMRIRNWPVAERRALVSAANPDWLDLLAAGGGGDRQGERPPAAGAAAEAAAPA